MAEEKKKDYSFELLGALVLFLLLALLCYFRVICPLPSCPENMVQCDNCPGNCCLPDGSCPCPAGSVPCSTYCPSTLNCPGGCCNIDTCACIATPQCPPNTIWSESRGCCLLISGPNAGSCAEICSVDPKRIACSLKGIDACDSNNCCPLGSLGWDQNQKCCIDSAGKCMNVCLLDNTRTSCPKPTVGGCDTVGCCPAGTYWDSNKECCLTEEGYCYGDPCAAKTCPVGQVCVNGECRTQGDLCANVNCPEGQVCNPATGQCSSNPCEGVNCPAGYICKDGGCIEDPCANVQCSTGQICINGVCKDKCSVVNCPAGQECDPMTGECISSKCSSGTRCNVCNLELGVCGGIIGSKACTSDSDCQGLECLPSGLCGTSTSEGGTGTLVSCNYRPPFTSCPSDIICSNGCAEEIKCTDKRLPEGQCKGVGEQCTSSTQCCCGTSCQMVNGQGFCCPGGLWQCGYQLD
ncbi:MAG: hypothetical protein N3G74_02160 [Candidatus Micrarchaeota archaeon]|nr:hypothetical protein [Candidatus Micrarchaeota archaeon]